MRYFFIALLCISLCGCREKIYEDLPEGVYIEEINNIEVYSDAYLFDLIKIEDAEIITDNYRVSTRTLGEKEIEVLYKFKKKKYVYTLKVTVEDTTPPEILAGSVRTIQQNHSGDLCDLFMIGDNYDRKPSCIIEGDYDVTKIGTYDITYLISDSSGNKIEHKLNLHVIKPSNNPSPGNTQTVAFSEVSDRYKNDRTEIGIDVSKWQQTIDFRKVKEAGATFVMMRIGVQKTVKGELEIDEYYYQNIKNAKEAGLKVGVYLYSIATSREESIEHAKWVLEKLDGTELELPIVFDWESWSRWNGLELSFHDINEIADAFIETINDNGYEGMLYSSKYYLERIWTNKKEHPVWLAHYTSTTDYAGEYMMWQMTDRGRIPGIKNNVDINIMYYK